MLKKVKLALIAFVLSLFPVSGYSCFDVYTIILNRPITYPAHEAALSLGTEYTFTHMSAPEEDEISLPARLYYGITEHFTAYAGGEVAGVRSPESFDYNATDIGLFYNVYNSELFSFTPAAETHFPYKGGAPAHDISMILTKPVNNWFVVLHPKLEMTPAEDGGTSNVFGYHFGVFYNFGSHSSLGWGHEYFDKALTTSLFIGSFIGDRLFFQTEIIKGLTDEAQNYGFAASLKYVL